jgi:nitrogen fixation NifU-like protein
MSELVSGMSPGEAEQVRSAFLELMRSKGELEPDEDVLGDGIAFAGVSKYPARVKCALLPWVALQDAEAKAGIGIDRIDIKEGGS